MHFNVLVFPCGSEIGLEIYRSLQFSRHIKLFGANSVDDHGKFVFENYISGLPFFNEDGFLEEFRKIIKENKIDAVYPAMDSVISFLKENEVDLGCKVIAPRKETSSLCMSKSKTYEKFKNLILTPKVFDSVNEIEKFPVFLKPDVGYGSRGTCKAKDVEDVKRHLVDFPESLILEYLPGNEITVDCFSSNKGELLFVGARERKRLSNGISVNTLPVIDKIKEIREIANTINSTLEISGAWFVQLKENVDGDYSLLEIAARLGGSSSLHRNLGVNFALLSVFNTFDIPVEVFVNNYGIELDRALDNKYKLSISYNTVYCDFDDCLVLGNQVNTQLVTFLYQAINEGKKLVLITKHENDINVSLRFFRLSDLFDEIIHLDVNKRKYEYMGEKLAIFIDDSHVERKQVFEQLGIPVFSPDSVESLIK